jgi:hypothetical protein
MFSRTPTEVRTIVGSGERVLSWARTDPIGFAVASDAALYLPVPQRLRLPWERIAKATWTEDGSLLVEGRSEASDKDRTWMVRIDEPRTLPTVIYERVTSSVVVSERVALEGELGARIVARRVGDGLAWTVTFDPGIDPRDPDMQSRAREAMAELRATLGV